MPRPTDNGPIGLAKALAELRAGRLDAAEALTARLLARAPHEPALHQLSATICLRRGDFQGASRWARSSLTLRPDHEPTLILAGRAARRCGDAAEALTRFRRAAELSPARPEAAFLVCATLLECQDARAAELLKWLARRFPDDAEGWQEIGLALRRVNRLEDALEAFRRADGAAPNPTRRLNEGMILQALNRPSEAIAAYRRALELAPNLAEASLRIALCQRQTGELEAARSRLEEIVAADRNNSHAWFVLGLVREDLGDPPGAILAYRSAVALRPDLAEAHVNLGLCLQHSGDLDMALAAYRQAIHARADTFGRVAQALPSASTGQLWLNLGRLRHSLGG